MPRSLACFAITGDRRLSGIDWYNSQTAGQVHFRAAQTRLLLASEAALKVMRNRLSFLRRVHA